MDEMFVLWGLDPITPGKAFEIQIWQAIEPTTCRSIKYICLCHLLFLLEKLEVSVEN